MTRGPRPDAVVVGAGIVGAACAHALSQRGLRVVVLDAAYPAGGATAAGMGHIVVMDDSPAQLALTARSRRLWMELSAEMPPACEDKRPGTLWLAASASEVATLEEKRQAYEGVGVRAEVLDAHALAEAEPALRPGLAGALAVPDDGVLYPPGAARWLLERAVALGAVLQAPSRAVDIGPSRVTVAVGGTRETIETGAVIVATGIDAPALVPELAVVPRKGHLVITERYPGLIHAQLVELGYLQSAHALAGASTAFNLQPRATGQVLIGSSRELVGRDATVNHDIVRSMVARAVEFVPALAGCLALRTWTGFRPATPDKLPLIGAWPTVAGVYVATGHEGLGITTATGTAELIADAVTGRAPAIDPRPFDPARRMPAMDTAA